MSKRRNLFASMVALLLTFGMYSCQDELADNDHYKAPNWLKGNAYEVLQKEGNYSIFLKGVDLSDFRDKVAGKSIVTVMAPNDEAFTAFLQEKGYASIEELNERDHSYLNRLIGYHIMYYAYDWSKMVNFRPTDGDGATEESKEVMAGYYYKHRTHSQDPIEQKRVKLTANATSDTLLTIYHYEHFLPVFSNKLFETKGIDAEYNYEYFYPQTEWNGITGGKGGFNIANAKVTDSDNVVTDNGYLYHVDRVLEPLKTIYQEMADNSNYSKFLEMYDQYAVYNTADIETNQALGYEAYVMGHSNVPSIAYEWPVMSWSALKVLESEGYNIFAPTNEAIDKFFTNFWTAEGGYEKLADLDKLITRFFIFQSFADEFRPVFPEEIKKGNVLTPFGSPINIDPDQVTDRKICSNGILYGMDEMKAPAIFSSVVGPAFKDTTYLPYLYALYGSEQILPLASNKTSFVTLMPSSKQLLETYPAIRLHETINGNELQQYNEEAGDFTAMGSGAQSAIVQMHVAANIESLPTSGTAVVTTNTPYNYWFVKDGQITTNALFNEQIEPTYEKTTPFVNLTPITNNGKTWDNGCSYAYDAEGIFEPVKGDGLSMKLAICNDKNYPYYMFSQLLKKAGLVTGTALSARIVTMTDRFFVFIPTNEAIMENLAKIPGCAKLKVDDKGTITGTLGTTDKNNLANYLCNFFVNSLMNSFTAYPYIGSSCKGSFLTSSGAKKIVVADNGAKLSVTLKGADTYTDVTPKYYYLPFAFADGCFHLIDGILPTE